MSENEVLKSKLTRIIRIGIGIFILGLFVSGVTAFPLETELEIICNYVSPNSLPGVWLHRVYAGILETNTKYPYMAYGTDWLAFAHLVIAVVFIGPMRDPIKNIWVIEFGLIACAGIFPLAFIAGGIREIPLFHQLIDCSFGVFGGTLLIIVYKSIKKLEALE